MNKVIIKKATEDDDRKKASIKLSNKDIKTADNMYLVDPEIPIENQEEEESQLQEHLKRKRRRFHNEPDGINENRFEGMQEQRNTFKGVGTDNSFGGPFNTTVPGWS